MKMTATGGWLVAALLCTTLAGCGDAGEQSADTTAADGGGALADFAPALNVDLDQMTRTETGLLYRDLAEGEGEAAQPGDQVVVHYTGWLPDGTEFDSSRGRNQPFEFSLGAGRVIPGWEEGVAGMRVGGRRQLVIPPALGYGPPGMPPAIPPNATLVFDVELLEIR